MIGTVTVTAYDPVGVYTRQLLHAQTVYQQHCMMHAEAAAGRKKTLCLTLHVLDVGTSPRSSSALFAGCNQFLFGKMAWHPFA